MALSKKLISQFAKTINELDHKEPEQRTLYGTAVLYDGRIYVQLDGSQQLTPLEDRIAGVSDGDRVTCVIENHSARITGNLTDPAANISIVEGLEGQINTFDTIIANKADIDELNAAIGRITDLEADNVTVTGRLDAAEANITDLTAENIDITGRLDANEANIGTLTASVAEIDDLVAQKADIEDLNATNATITNLQADVAEVGELVAQKADISDLNAMNATITNLLAEKADIDDLNALHATIEDLDANKADIVDLDAVKADIIDLDAKKADIESLDAQYANIDFANIGMAAVEELFAKSGIIEDMVVGDQHITGHLVGVTISGDLIEGNTIKADKLVVQGTDGLYYKLNISGETVAAEQTEYNSLNGSVITAHSITAEKVNVDDLVAFNADIGGYHIADGKLYSGAKADVNNTTRGVYLGADGQAAIGDADNYLKFFKDPEDSKWKLIISASSILMGGGDSVEDAISNAGKLTERTCGEQPYVFGKNGGRAPYELKLYGQTRQNLWEILSATAQLGITIVNNDDGSVTLSGTTTSNNIWLGYKQRYVLRPGSTYTLSVDKAPPAGVYFRVESRDAENNYAQIGSVHNTRLSHTFTVPSNSAYCNFLFTSYAAVGTTVSGTYRVMLNEGSTAQPWCPPGLNGVDELSVVVGGECFTCETHDVSSKYATAADLPAPANECLKPSTEYMLCIGVSSGRWYFNEFVFSTPTTYREVGVFALPITTKDTLTATTVCIKTATADPCVIDYCYLIEGGTTTPIDLDGHALNSLPDGTRDELTVDASGNVTLLKNTRQFQFPSSGGQLYYTRLAFVLDSKYVSAVTTGNEMPGNFLCDKAPGRQSAYASARTEAYAVSAYAYAQLGGAETADDIYSVYSGGHIIYPLATPKTISLGKVSLPAVPADAATIWYSVPTGLTPEGCVELWTEEGAKVADAQIAADAAAQGSIASQTVAYQLSSQGTNPPTGVWLATMPTPVKGQYLWTRVITVFVSGETSTEYTVAYQGKDGAKGDQGVQGPPGNDGADGKDGADGADGTSVTITSTSVTYQKSSSGTTVPTGTWTTSIPSISAGQYLWSRTIVNYSNGKSTTTYNPSRSGTNGANGTNGTDGKDGADGNGIKSTSVTYQAHSSQTSAPSGSWSSSIPKLSPAKPYLWTRTILTFDDNTTKTLYSVSSTLEGVEVGGRNLIKNSTFKTDTSLWVAENCSVVQYESVNADIGTAAKITVTGNYATGREYGRFYSSTVNNFTHESGELYTLTVWVDVMASGMSVYVGRSGAEQVIMTCTPSSANAWYKFTTTYTSSGIGSLSFYANKAGSFAISKIKLERGNKATDWTPAPEDVEADIDDAAKTATNYLSFSSSTGLIITQNAASPSSGKNVQITSTAINIRNSTTVLSQFTESQILLGQSSGRNALINTNGIYLRSGATNLAAFTSTALTLGQSSSDHVTIESGRIEFWKNTTSLGVFSGGITRLGVLSGMNSYFTADALQFRYGDSTVLGSITSNTLTLGKTNDSNTVINQNGIYLRESTTNLAQFTSGAVILGNEVSKHVVLTADKLEFRNNTTSLGAFTGSALRLGPEGWGYFYANAAGAQVYDEDGASCANIAAGTARIGKSNSYNTYITGSSIALRSSSTVLTSITASSITLGRTDGSYKNLYMTSSAMQFRSGSTVVAQFTPTLIELGKNFGGNDANVGIYMFNKNFYIRYDTKYGATIERTGAAIYIHAGSTLRLVGNNNTVVGNSTAGSTATVNAGSVQVGTGVTSKVQIGMSTSSDLQYSLHGIYCGTKTLSIAANSVHTVLFTSSQFSAIVGREYKTGDTIAVSNGDYQADGRTLYCCCYRGDNKTWYINHASRTSSNTMRINFTIIAVHN